MNSKKNNTESQGTSPSNLLDELRNFIGEQTNEIYVKRSVPLESLTDGLGLTSPPKRADLPPPPVVAMATETTVPPAIPVPAPRNQKLQSVLHSPAENISTSPPPLPQTTFTRRLMAAVIDYLFTLSVLFFSMGLWWRVAESTHSTFDLKILLPAYFVIWFFYLGIGIGFLETTLGMWLLGLHLKFGQHEEAKGLKKFARIFYSSFSNTLVIPNVALLFFRKGKNLLDTISSTQVYRVA